MSTPIAVSRDTIGAEGVQITGEEIQVSERIDPEIETMHLSTDEAPARHAGVAPTPASSGKHDRYRLHRGGDRQLNRALHVVAITRARIDPPTQEYIQRRIEQGNSRGEALRCLKRHLARRFQLIPSFCCPSQATLTYLGNTASLRLVDSRPLNALLRELREEQGKSLRQAARALDVNPAYLSRVERGQKSASPAVLQRASAYYHVPAELLNLSRGQVPADVVRILQSNPDLLEDLRTRYGSG